MGVQPHAEEETEGATDAVSTSAEHEAVAAGGAKSPTSQPAFGPQWVD